MGLGGDVDFVKGDVEIQLNKALMFGTVGYNFVLSNSQLYMYDVKSFLGHNILAEQFNIFSVLLNLISL